MSEPRLIVVPGLGADERMFEPQRKAFGELIVAPWIEPHDGESLADYARRLAEKVDPGANGPLYLGGVSAGGMIAQEMARHLKPRAVFMVATCASGAELPLRARGLERVSRWMNDWMVRRLTCLRSFMHLGAGDVAEEHLSLLIDMYRRTPVSFLRWLSRSVVEWRPSGRAGVPTHHIHGAKDRVIPLRGVKPDLVIADGGHMINFSHAAQVNQFIRQRMN
jgi:pimeloyl-ACP methyl ester carboxylesterase